MSDESPILYEDTSGTGTLPGRIGGRLVPVMSRIRQKMTRLRDSRVGQWMEGQAAALAEYLIRPETLRHLQRVMAFLAQHGMERGFEADPDARRLFEFAEWLEVRHGRASVMQAVLERNPILDGSTLRLAEMVVRPNASAETLRGAISDARLSVLRTLANMASLEDGSSQDLDRMSIEELRRSIEQREMPERFRGLAAMAAGIPDSFEDSSPKPGESPDTRGSSSALTRFVPDLRDPATRFLLTTFTFFVQAYVTRDLVERFPEMMETIDSLSTGPAFEGEEIIDQGDE